MSEARVISHAKHPQITELNIAQLGLISATKRLNLTEWTAVAKQGDIAGEIFCESLRAAPHGIDADTVSALVTLYYLQDCPENFAVRVSFSALLKAMYLADTGPNRAIVLKSLERLKQGQFRFRNAWSYEGALVKLKSAFSIVDRVDDIRRHPDHQVIQGRDEHDLVIYLGSALAHSVNARQILTLRPDVLTQLSSCVARSVYRTFEGIRVAGSAPDELKKHLILDTAELAGYLRLLTPKEVDVPGARLKRVVGEVADSTTVQRVMKPALESLTKMGYVERAEIVGRGKRAALHLSFQADGNVMDMHSVKVLETLEITADTAHMLAMTHTREVIEAVCAFAQEKPGIRSPSGFAIAKLTAGEGPGILSQMRAKRTMRAAQVPSPGKRVLPAEAEPEEQVSLETQAEKAVKTVQFLLQKRLSTEAADQLRCAFLAGQLDPVDTTRAAAKAKAEGQLNVFVQELQNQMRSNG